MHLTLYFGPPQNCLPPFFTAVAVIEIVSSPQSQMGPRKVVMLPPLCLELDRCWCTSIRLQMHDDTDADL